MKNVPFFIKKTSVLLLGMSLFLGSCEIVDDGDQESFTSIDAYFSKKEVKPTSYKIDASIGGSFTTDKGSVLTIPENSFMTQDGKTVSGSVDIELKEVFSNADIINSGVFPVSGNNVLNSGGEFYVEARSNGELLKTSPGNFISLNIPAQAVAPNMQLFFGGPEQDTGDVNWMPIDTIPIDTMRGDTAQRFRSNSSFVFNSADNSYEIKLDSMGWGNIDAFMSTRYFDCTFNLVGLEGLDERLQTILGQMIGSCCWLCGLRNVSSGAAALKAVSTRTDSSRSDLGGVTTCFRRVRCWPQRRQMMAPSGSRRVAAAATSSPPPGA